tara:strand:- start:79 stop:408 length:330 start_codon:yes stop_codon:yes gene_type:complete
MNDSKFLIISKRTRLLNQIFLREGLKNSHIILLSTIIERNINNEVLPNVKWLQTELQISFTKVKKIINALEKNKYIIKVPDHKDKRVKYLDITEKGKNYIYGICDELPW